MTQTSPFLIFTWGNPSRGDDAIGPILFEDLQQQPLDQTEILTDFQLQIEHITDLSDRRQIVFVDACLNCPEPFSFESLQAKTDNSFTTHAMSPVALLAVFEQVYQSPPPPAWLLSIRAYEFDLGQPLSKAALANLSQAEDYLRKQICQWLDST